MTGLTEKRATVLGERAARAFDRALAELGDVAGLAELRAELETARSRLGEPMRVAIVGKIKAGKSTLMNGLLGQRLAATGTEELTFNVNWFRHGERPRLLVHFKDGREPEPRLLEELDALTGRNDAHRELLRSIRHIEVRHPAELLRRFDLIDTPGLRSVFADDERNTLEFLGLTGDELDAITARESSGADAILCLFSRSFGVSDESFVGDFRGPALGDATPVNAIGVLTKVDAYWPQREDPIAEGQRIAARLAAAPGADRVFYAVLPVAGQLGFGAQTLTADELETIDALAAQDGAILARRLRWADRFATRDYDDLPVGAAPRRALLQRLGQYGVHLACELRREGLASGALRDELLARSGLAELRELVLSHFGNRAQLIKTGVALQRGLARVAVAQRSGHEGERRAAAAASRPLEELQRREPAFEELALLRRYYAELEAIGLTQGEREELLRVTGEHGTAAAARLGVGERALPREMLAVAERRLDYWRERGLVELEELDRYVALGLATAYERIVIHVREAARHLEIEW